MAKKANAPSTFTPGPTAITTPESPPVAINAEAGSPGRFVLAKLMRGVSNIKGVKGAEMPPAPVLPISIYLHAGHGLAMPAFAHFGVDGVAELDGALADAMRKHIAMNPGAGISEE